MADFNLDFAQRFRTSEMKRFRVSYIALPLELDANNSPEIPANRP